MIGSPGNILTQPCPEVNKTVPYFEEFYPDPEKGEYTVNKYLYDILVTLSNVHVNFTDKDYTYPELALLPDGAITIKEANPKKLSYNVQINDSKYWAYHRNNGISKIGVFDEEMNKTQVAFRVVEGLIGFADMIN